MWPEIKMTIKWDDFEAVKKLIMDNTLAFDVKRMVNLKREYCPIVVGFGWYDENVYELFDMAEKLLKDNGYFCKGL